MRQNISLSGNIPASVRAFGLVALVLGPALAQAHTGADGGMHHGFRAGFAHPFTGIDHLAAMVAVGLWSALSARKAWPDLLWAPLGFASMLLVGGMLGLAGVQAPGVEPLIAASVLVLGLLVLFELRLPGLLAAALVGGFAVFHGLSHGYELAGTSAAWPTLLGMLLATALLHLCGIAVGWVLRQRSQWAPRLLGAGVATLGAGLLWSLV